MKKNMMKPMTTCIIFWCALLLPPSVWATDHDRAKILLERGQVLALSDILKLNDELLAGKILAVDLEEEDSFIVYEIKFLGEHGVVKEMLLDARTGKILSVKED
ncbi:MAG: hypothetical protein R8K50_08445 [Mariprofundus sp.]